MMLPTIRMPASSVAFKNALENSIVRRKLGLAWRYRRLYAIKHEDQAKPHAEDGQ